MNLISEIHNYVRGRVPIYNISGVFNNYPDFSIYKLKYVRRKITKLLYLKQIHFILNPKFSICNM